MGRRRRGLTRVRKKLHTKMHWDCGVRARRSRCCRRSKKQRSRETSMTRKFGWAGFRVAAGRRLACFGALVALALLGGSFEASAQTPSASLPGVDPALLEDIAVGSRILA